MQAIPTQLTIVELSDALNLTVQGVHFKANKENWVQAKSGGKKKLYTYATLPADVQRAIQKHYMDQVEPGLVQVGQAIPQTVASPTVSATPDRGLLPPWAEETAKARFDLIHKYDLAKSKLKRGELSTFDADFLEAYNTSSTFPTLFKALGKVSRSTLKRWAKQLTDANNDYYALAPNWGSHRSGKSKLTPCEYGELFKQLFHQNRIKVGTAIGYAKRNLKAQGKVVVSSDATFRRVAKSIEEQYYDKWIQFREGDKALLDKVAPYLERDDSLLSVGQCLVADGHVCNFDVMNPETGKPARPLAIVFYDWKSRDPVGISISFTEDTQVINNALRDAILELGKIPEYVYLDNGKAFKSKFFTEEIDFEVAGLYGVYARLGIQTVFAKPYNARAKVVERFFRTFGDQFERYMPSFCGASIQDKPASMHRNEKFMQSFYNREAFTLDQTLAMFKQWREIYREGAHPTVKGKTRGEVFKEGRGPGVNPDELRFLMMASELKTIHRNGITLFKEHYYDPAMYGIRKKVIVRYDLNDLSKVYIYLGETGEFLCTAPRREKIDPLVQFQGSPKDLAEFKRQAKEQASLTRSTKRIAAKRLKLLRAAEAVEVMTPELREAAELELAKKIGVVIKETIEVRAADDARDYHVDIDTEPTESEPTPVVEEPESIVRQFESEVELYEYLCEKETLTKENIKWLEEKFYPTQSGQAMLEMDGNIILKKIAV